MYDLWCNDVHHFRTLFSVQFSSEIIWRHIPVNKLLTEERRKRDKESNDFLCDENHWAGDFEKASRTEHSKRRTHIYVCGNVN